MSRAALRKAQHNLFDAGPAAHSRPQAPIAGQRKPFVHPCQAPGCEAWGERGFAGGVFFCFEHRAMGEPVIGAAGGRP